MPKEKMQFTVTVRKSEMKNEEEEQRQAFFGRLV